MVALHASLRRGPRTNQADVMKVLRQAEAPFRQSGGLTIRPDIAMFRAYSIVGTEQRLCG
jgi:hypothetical protein